MVVCQVIFDTSVVLVDAGPSNSSALATAVSAGRWDSTDSFVSGPSPYTSVGPVDQYGSSGWQPKTESPTSSPTEAPTSAPTSAPTEGRIGIGLERACVYNGTMLCHVTGTAIVRLRELDLSGGSITLKNEGGAPQTLTGW